MEEFTEVTLKSGSTLKINLAPFIEGKALYQAVLEEMKTIKIDPEAQLDINLFKDLFCAGFSSKKVEACLSKCLDRSLYNGVKITDASFEPKAAREDYLPVCFEVAKVNLLPFTKALTQQYSQILEMLKTGLA